MLHLPFVPLQDYFLNLIFLKSKIWGGSYVRLNRLGFILYLFIVSRNFIITGLVTYFLLLKYSSNLSSITLLYVPVRVTRAVIANRYTYAPPSSTKGLIPLSVSLWNDLGDPIFDGAGPACFKSRANAFLLAKQLVPCLSPTVFPCSSFSIWVGIVGLGIWTDILLIRRFSTATWGTKPIIMSAGHVYILLHRREKWGSTIQYGYRKRGTHARVFSQTLTHGNSKNEIRQRDKRRR